MASLPSLFDRLTLAAPSGAAPSGTDDSLKRDLSALLNATALSASQDLSRWPLVSRSVLNFGVPGFTGRMLTNADIPEIQRHITKAIQQFEPRLHPKRIRVSVLTDPIDGSPHGWRVRIEAQRRDVSDRMPLEFWAVIEPETGQLQMSD